MTEYECPSCQKHKETIKKLIDRYTEVVCMTEHELSGIDFVKQMDIILERLKHTFPADPFGEYHIHINNNKPMDNIEIKNDSEEIFRPREKITKFTIYYREFIEE